MYITALYCSAVQCIPVYCTTLHWTTLHFTALHCTVMHCSAVEQRDSVRRAPLAEENGIIGEVAAIYRNRRIGESEVPTLFKNRIITE